MSPTLPDVAIPQTTSYRLVNSKFPPISLFDDVANADEFEALYALQSRTNPRIQNEVGNLRLLSRDEIPFGIRGCSYAVAPFTHINPDGSRFDAGNRGVLYLADRLETALAEVAYHQDRYWRRVPALKFDRLVFRSLACTWGPVTLVDATRLAPDDLIYASEDYTAARALGAVLRKAGKCGVQYHSVRQPGGVCWGLFTPKPVHGIVQCSHFEMIWDGQRIRAVHQVTSLGT